MIADDVGRAHSLELDRQMINGSAASGQMRALLAVSGLLCVTATTTNASTVVSSVWSAYSALSYGSGFGAPTSTND